VNLLRERISGDRAASPEGRHVNVDGEDDLEARPLLDAVQVDDDRDRDARLSASRCGS